ncbi:MAG: ABC transporter ATP-binding protein, partial [Nitrospiraceae bacterium]
SGGQRQRVALGRAIIRKPVVFLMDEPLSNLDARLRIEMRAELKKLHQELKITTIYVTHDQAEAMSMSDRIAVIYNGEVQQCGTPREIYMKPTNMMVAGFVGSPPMNFLPARLINSDPVEIDCSGVVLSSVTDSVPGNVRFTAGIRPEDITVYSVEKEGSIEVDVSIIESAGPFNWADVKWGDTVIKGISELDDRLEPGKTGFAAIAKDKVMLFDAETGLRV